MNFLLRSDSPRQYIPAGSGRPLNNIFYPPALVLAQRATLLNQDDIADIALVGRIMGHIFHSAANELSIELVSYFSLNKDNNGLVHCITDNGSLARLSGFDCVTHTFQSGR
jgi:hypothetical protein